MGTSGQDIHSTGTSLISLAFIVGIKRSIGRRSRLCSGFWVSAGWVQYKLMEHLSLDFWTRQTQITRQVSEDFSHLLTAVWTSVTERDSTLFVQQEPPTLRFSSKEPLSTSVITLSTCFCSNNQSQWKSFLRVWKGYSLDLGSRGWSHCQHLKCCWLVETPWGPILAAYPLSRAKMLSSRSRLQMGASFLSKMALKWKSALFVSSMQKNPKLSAYSGHDLHVHRPNRLNTPTRHPCVLHHLHLWFF